MTEATVPDNLKYTADHEWVRQDGDSLVIGITHHAQAELGDVVFLELPEVGTALKANVPFGVVESVKAVSDLVAPIDGEVLEINQALIDAPESVNSSPYDDAWMLKVKPSAADSTAALMNAAAYRKHLADES